MAGKSWSVRDGLFVIGGDEAKGAAVHRRAGPAGARFSRGEYLETVPVYRGGVLIKSYTICRLFNYSGYRWPTEPGRY